MTDEAMNVHDQLAVWIIVGLLGGSLAIDSRSLG